MRREPTSPSVEQSLFHFVIAILLIIAAGVICYSNSFSGPFVLDDLGAIADNTSIRDLSKVGTILTGATHATVIGRPLLNLSLAMNYRFAGTEVIWDYHAFNLAAHLAAALILFGVVRRTLLLSSIPLETQRQATGLAFAVSLIWTVHPLQTESVTYIVQRAESMVAVFYFASLYCVIRGATGGKPVSWYMIAVMACALGMATKEVMVTAPLVIFFYDRIFLCRSFAEIRQLRSGLYAGLAATWVWLALLMNSSQGRSNTAGFGLGISSWDYAMTQFGFIVRYLKLCFWPHPLVFDYGDPIARTPMEIVPYALIVFSLLIAAVVAVRFRPWIGFLGVSFFLILAPTSSIVPLVTQTAAEHRMYLPLAAIVTLFVLLGSQILDWIVVQRTRHQRELLTQSRNVRIVALTLVVVGLGYLTYQRNKDYRSELTLWERTARDFPSNARAFHAIGCSYLKTGQISRAIDMFNRAIDLNLGVIQAFYNRGNAFAVAGKYDLAIEDFHRAVEMAPNPSPDRAQAYYQMGNAYGYLGKHDKALQCFTLALEAQPEHTDARTMVEKVTRHLGRQQD